MAKTRSQRKFCRDLKCSEKLQKISFHKTTRRGGGHRFMKLFKGWLFFSNFLFIKCFHQLHSHLRLLSSFSQFDLFPPFFSFQHRLKCFFLRLSLSLFVRCRQVFFFGTITVHHCGDSSLSQPTNLNFSPIKESLPAL